MTNTPTRSRPTDKSLADQLQINDREIAYRKSLLNISDDDVAILRECHDHVANHVDKIVKEFYQKQLEIPEIALLIGDAETLQRLQVSMRRYILEIFEGYYDAEYINKRLRIGKVHKRIGVSPKLYISAITLLEEVVFSYLDDAPQLKTGPDKKEQCERALHHLMMFDVQLVFDTYITSLVAEVEAAKDELESYAASLEETIQERTQQLQEMSAQDNLTGLKNQRAFYENLRRELASASRTGNSVALAYMDLNGFKQMNDQHGHREGDRILAKVGKLLAESVREIDIACRYGGDEFCIIMPGTDQKAAKMACLRISESFYHEDDLDASFSMGIAVADPDVPTDPDTLIQKADQLMYQAKKLAGGESVNVIQVDETLEPSEPNLSVVKT